MSTHRGLDQAGQDRAGKLANLNPGSGKLMQGVADCCALLVGEGEGAWLMKSHNNKAGLVAFFFCKMTL
jgi:hypothetical protein